MKNLENFENAKIVHDFVKKYSEKNENLKILDICCGVYNKKGRNYDENGLIYKPLVAQLLGKNGHNVFGLDIRENDVYTTLYYKHLTNPNFLEKDLKKKFLELGIISQKSAETHFDIILFLRSWDTPEILLYFQNKLKITDLNILSEKIAKILISKTLHILKPGGVFITSEIFNFSLLNSELEIDHYTKKTRQIFHSFGLRVVEEKNGLYFLVLGL